ncbi:tigger transposable element-derived protein 1 [Elysia marginata]|uniref:Tigger transposable element-derived protein 1 n=1 Tax=Elysia marginata TaxID=1093978 RepID=A0AAV4GD20_9GAST|nr:tigger transposable element-derived protein 1 [Elysia marginata]
MDGFPEAHFAKSANGWIDSQIFYSWLIDAFIPAVADLEKPVILFMDGHKTHTSLDVSELCRNHNIILYMLPSHASHAVQPLDLTTFKRLKQVWKEEVLAYQEEKSDTLSKKDFARTLKKAWQRGIERDVVVAGFRAAGIYPWDPDHVDLTKLGPARLFDPSRLTVADMTSKGAETSSSLLTVTDTPDGTEAETVTETVPVTETATQTETVVDTVTVTETVADTVTVTETVGDTVTVTETVADTVTVTDRDSS